MRGGALPACVRLSLRGRRRRLRLSLSTQPEDPGGLGSCRRRGALGISRVDWLAIVLCIIVVSVAEVVNTAIESAVDLASPEWHELARAAKDAAAGAVLLASAGSVIVGLIVFSPYVLDLL